MYAYVSVAVGVGFLLLYFRARLRWMVYTSYGLLQLGMTLRAVGPMLAAETKLVQTAGVGLTLFGLIKISVEVLLIRHLMGESTA